METVVSINGNVPAIPVPGKSVPEMPAAVPAPPEEKIMTPLLQPAVIAPGNVPDLKKPGVPDDASGKATQPAPASWTRILVIAGIVGFFILAALAYVVLLPMLSGPGAAGVATGLSLPASLPSPTKVPAGSVVQSTPAVSFEPQPTQRVPVNLEVTYQAERNPITGLVTVTFTGGPGMNGISQTVVTLTKSDGGVETRSFKPKQIGDFVTLQGTLKTDRIEVITNFYNGNSYRVIDQLFEYKKKN
jgi:hypothetical protein